MKKLYREYLRERDKLNRLVVRARGKKAAIAEDERIMEQSRKVDEVVGKLCRWVKGKQRIDR